MSRSYHCICSCNLHQPGARHRCRCQLLLRPPFSGWVCLLPGPSLNECPSRTNRGHHFSTSTTQVGPRSCHSLDGKWPVLPPIAALVLVVQRLQRLHHLHSPPAIFESVTNRRRQHHNTPKHLSHSTAPVSTYTCCRHLKRPARSSWSPAPKFKSLDVKSNEP